MERKNSFVKIYRWRDEAVFAGILLAFAFMINHGIEIRGLSGEDLSDLYITYSHIFSLRWWAPTYLGLCLVI